MFDAYWLAVDSGSNCTGVVAAIASKSSYYRDWRLMGRDRTDIIYSEIVKMVKVPRGIGFWGDMVLTLRDGRLELRAVPKFPRHL